MTAQIEMLAGLAQELKVAERDQVALGHILKARARDYVGRAALLSGSGESLDKVKCAAVYARLLKRAEDPVFTNRVCRIIDPWQACAEEQNRLKREIGKVVKTMPIWTQWGVNQVGISESGLGKLLGHCPGDFNNGLSDFANPGKLWKWFGLHVNENGQAPRPTRGMKLGFSPYRLGVAFVVDKGLLMNGIRENEAGVKVPVTTWGELYYKRKDFEIQKAHVRGLEVVPAKKNMDLKKFMSEGHVHKCAMRFVTKRFFRDLWKAWRTV